MLRRRLLMGTLTSYIGRAWAKIAPAIILAMILAGPASKTCSGQTFAANLSGVVTDPNGAVVPGVAVELKNSATNDLRQATTGPDGAFVFPDLNPGTYDLSVKAPGFQHFVREGITLFAGRSSELNVKLEVGQPSETVEVKGTAALLDTKSANESATLNRTLVTELPTNTRTPLNFVFAFAGTVPAPGGMYSPDQTFDQMFNSFGLNGGRSMSTAILLDGAPATAADWGGLIVSPTVDSVQELQVTRSTYDAQYGRAGSSVI